MQIVAHVFVAVNPSVLNIKILQQLGANLQHSNLGFFKMILHFVKCTILEKQSDKKLCAVITC